jgi:hypothetical protein
MLIGTKRAAIRKWQTAPSRDTSSPTPAMSRGRPLADKKAWSGSSFKATTSLGGLSTSVSKTTAPLESGTSKPAEAAERRQIRLQVSAAASAATQPPVSRPVAGPDSTPSEKWPITLPRIVPARSLPTSPTSTSPVDTASANQTAMEARMKARKVFRRLEQTRLRQGSLPRQGGDDNQIVGHGGLHSEHDDSIIPARSPSTTFISRGPVGTASANNATMDAEEETKREFQTRLRQAGRPRQLGDDLVVGGGELDIVPARKPFTAQKLSLDATPIDPVRSTPAKERHRHLRQAVQNGGDFEIVGHGELDDEFDLVESEVPSAVNGSSLLDANDIIDGLDNAFRADWDDEE